MRTYAYWLRDQEDSGQDVLDQVFPPIELPGEAAQ